MAAPTPETLQRESHSAGEQPGRRSDFFYVKTLVSFYVCSWLMDLWRSQPPHYRGDRVELVILNWMRQETNWRWGWIPTSSWCSTIIVLNTSNTKGGAEFSTSPHLSDLSLTCHSIKTGMSDVKVVSRPVSLVCIQSECWVHVRGGGVKKNPICKTAVDPQILGWVPLLNWS